MITTARAKHAPTLPQAVELDRLLTELDVKGFTVLPGFLDHDTTGRLRAHIDALLESTSPVDDSKASRIHNLRHPLSGDIMAEMITEQHLELSRQILHAKDLRLLEQVFLRTDQSPEPGPGGGWHIDFAFYPRHYAARPRQTYVHMVHVLSTIEPGGGATMIVPGSHHLNYAAAERLSVSGERFAVSEQDAFKAEIMRTAGVDTSQGIEIPAREGDLILFNPMCAHTSSRNLKPQVRYVMFMSFFDACATEMNAQLNHTKYRDNFPVSLRDGLPPHWRSLLDR